MRLMTGLLLVSLTGCGDHERQPLPSAPAVLSQAPATVPATAQPQTTPKVVMDVMEVVGRTEAEVSALLGPPASCKDIHRARLCEYPPEQDEVMFVAGKADMITVRGMGAVVFNEDALDALGLKTAKPDHSDQHAIGWQSLPDLEEVTVFPGQGNFVDYAYVKARKP